MFVPLRPIAVIFVAVTLLVFSGGFFEQAILGPEYNISGGSVGTAKLLNAAIYFLAYCIGLFFIFINWRLSVVVLRDFGLFFLFSVSAFATAAWSILPGITIVETIQLVLTITTAVGIAAAIDFDRFLRAAFYTCLAAMLLSFFYIFFVPHYGLMTSTNEFSRLVGLPQGIFMHKNAFGEFALMSALIALAAFNLVPPWLRILLLVLGLGGLAISGSATRLASGLAAISVYLAWTSLNVMRYGRVFSLVSAVVASVLMLVIFDALLKLIPTLLNRDLTFTGRTYIWAHAFEFIEQRPFLGHGFGAFWRGDDAGVPEMPYFEAPHAHNLVVEILLGQGIVGLLIAIAAMIKITMSLAAYPTLSSNAYKLAFLMFMYTVIASFLEPPLFRGNQYPFLVTLIALAYLRVEAFLASHEADRQPAPKAPVGAVMPRPVAALSGRRGLLTRRLH